MSFAPAAILIVLALAAAIPGLTLGVAMLLAGRPGWLGRGHGRRQEPGIQAFLMLSVLVVFDAGLVFLLPWAVAFGGLSHRFTAVLGLFLAALSLLGVGYGWRRGALRWD